MPTFQENKINITEKNARDNILYYNLSDNCNAGMLSGWEITEIARALCQYAKGDLIAQYVIYPQVVRGYVKALNMRLNDTKGRVAIKIYNT